MTTVLVQYFVRSSLKSLLDSPGSVSKVESFDMEAGLVIVTLVLEALLSSAEKGYFG